MKQQNNNLQDEFQTSAENGYFDTGAVQTAQPVMALDETPTRTAPRFQRVRAPVQRLNNRFGPVFMILALLAVTALGVIAGTMVYRSTTDKASNTSSQDPEGNEPVIRTVTPQVEYVVEKPGSDQTETLFETPKNSFAPETNPVSENNFDPVLRNNAGEKQPPQAQNEKRRAEQNETDEQNPAPETVQNENTQVEVAEKENKEQKKTDEKQQKEDVKGPSNKEDKQLEKLLQKHKISDIKPKETPDNSLENKDQ